MFINPMKPKIEYACVTMSNKVAALFDDQEKAEAYRDRVNPSWSIVQITTEYVNLSYLAQEAEANEQMLMIEHSC